MGNQKESRIGPDDAQALEKVKLQEEVRSLKQQRLIAFLSAIGAVLAFAVTNYTKITDIFYPPPKFRLSIEDIYLKEVGAVVIYPSGDSAAGPVLQTSVAEALDWLPMEEGAYRLELMVDDARYFSRELFLAAGDRETLVIPEQRTQAIKVTVFNDTPRPPPGSPLQLRVISSGNGFVWIYDLPATGGPALVYPPLADIGGRQHAISAGEIFGIPDPANNAIFVANEPGAENLLIVVTSSGQRTTADKIAARMSAAKIVKASAGRIEENWGVTQLRYEVGI